MEGKKEAMQSYIYTVLMLFMYGKFGWNSGIQ